ncbi:hypothetical protein A1Q2_02094 [Trichosporon asahii var. asahii CBS 8904]|uniref:EF-hand domain-containing protein n=1 Tax=Trichosporon asahii var. asahii (strain CBS 8904) TaxID=1220162 RepID=K1VVZ3_TRIAC|nr:hypothetical protein A1Q2_02094 [Trichosporon asahii var. asahii CBS 8904]
MAFIAPLLLATMALAHGGHGHGADDPHAAAANDDSLGYAQRHFDLPAFFKLHDLDSDGFWTTEEIAALYGLRHHSVTGEEKKTPEGLEEQIVSAVLAKLDKNGDSKISLKEYVAGGVDGLPTIGDFKHLGHHYDEESEYFLHHEELYHNTPETQTDESYTHPEDIEHFKYHEKIEAEEDARERLFEGLAPDADLDQDHAAQDPLDAHAHAAGDGPKPDSDEQKAHRLVKGKLGAGSPNRLIAEAAGGRPKHRHSDAERARKDAPWKYRMRAGLRSDEF